MRRAGVTIIAGTDAGYLNSFDYPGQSLHTELALMVQYGLSPLAALQASIINGPGYFHLQQQNGKIAKEFFADLLVLDGNPLKDIANTRCINSEIIKGRYLNRAVLDRHLKKIAAKAAASPFKSIE